MPGRKKSLNLIGKRYGKLVILDRKNNSKGYTKDNIQLVVYIYNLAKSYGTYFDVLRMCYDIIAMEEKRKLG